MSDSVKKYFEQTTTANVKTIYPGGIKMTIDSYPNYKSISKIDSFVEAVKLKYDKRSERGMEKYGTNLEREDLDISEWLNHLQEELMDATLYIEKLKSKIEDKLRDR